MMHPIRPSSLRGIRPALCGLAAMLILLACVSPSAVAQTVPVPEPEVTVEQLEGKIRVNVDGELFTEYVYADTPKPYLYPVIGPGGVPMTRNFPMKDDVPGEEHDHPHHRSMWFAHGLANGVDFWTEHEGTGTTVQEEILEVSAEGNRAVIRTRNRWVGPDGKAVAGDTRELRFIAWPDARAIDWQVTIHASEGPLKLGDTKEGTMAVRTHPNLRLNPAREGQPREVFGQAVNSEGVKGIEEVDGRRTSPIWGRRARWVDYWGPIDGRTVGIAIFDAPTNPSHPTWWMARDYGLVAAGPFGANAFEPDKYPRGAGDIDLAEGESVTFTWRFLLHEGDPETGRVEERYEAFAEEILKGEGN